MFVCSFIAPRHIRLKARKEYWITQINKDYYFASYEIQSMSAALHCGRQRVFTKLVSPLDNLEGRLCKRGKKNSWSFVSGVSVIWVFCRNLTRIRYDHAFDHCMLKHQLYVEIRSIFIVYDILFQSIK